jgi:protoporphyrinogen oxidase
MMGLTVGLRLAQRGHAVRVYEGERKVGGLAAAGDIGAWSWDRFYHVILMSDTALTGLLGEIGLDDRLRWGTTRTGFFVDGKWISMSTALEFLRFPPLNLVDKARLGATILMASRISDPLPLEKVSALEWLERWSGHRTTERIWAPLMRAKLGENANDASAAFIWAIIARMYAARRTGLKREMMGYVEGGYDVIVPALRRHAERAGVEVVTGSMVTSVRDDGGGAVVTVDGDGDASFDSAVLTVSCPIVSRLCPQLTRMERERLARVVYQGVVCPSWLLKRPLAGFYVTNITDTWVPFTGVIETTALVDRSAFGGNTLVYLPRYLTQGDRMWNVPDEQVSEEFFAALCRMVPGLSKEDIVASRVARAREVLAVSTLNYSSEVMPALETSMPHVFIANSAQIAHGTLNVNETILLAERQALEVHGRLATRTAVAA